MLYQTQTSVLPTEHHPPSGIWFDEEYLLNATENIDYIVFDDYDYRSLPVPRPPVTPPPNPRPGPLGPAPNYPPTPPHT